MTRYGCTLRCLRRTVVPATRFIAAIIAIIASMGSGGGLSMAAISDFVRIDPALSKAFRHEAALDRRGSEDCGHDVFLLSQLRQVRQSQWRGIAQLAGL